MVNDYICRNIYITEIIPPILRGYFYIQIKNGDRFITEVLLTHDIMYTNLTQGTVIKVNEFEIYLPKESELTLNVHDKSLYNYDFNSYSLVPLQNLAAQSVSEKIKNHILSNVSSSHMVKKSIESEKEEYVANLSEIAKEKIKSGDWKLGVRKNTGETYAVLKDATNGQTKSYINLDKKIVSDLGDLPELSAIQGQIAAISEKIEDLNRLVERVEQGQYNDRFAGFFSARQLIVEGLATKDVVLKKNLLMNAISTANKTIAELMLSVHQDSNSFLDMSIKKKDAQRIDNLLQSSIGYLNSTVQLNIVAYMALGERQALFATINNYQSYLNQTLLIQIGDNNKTVSWKIDNAHEGNDGKFEETTLNLSKKITHLIEINENNQLGVGYNEKSETNQMLDA